jgi:hypothetical protein
VSKNINYLPHKGYETKKDNSFEDYLNNLSSSVSKACDLFFIKRGIPIKDTSYCFFNRNKKSPEDNQK